MVGELSGVPGLSRIANVLHIRRIEGELNVPCLSAERAGQKWSANGQKATNQ